jgi:hypothetical protein
MLLLFLYAGGTTPTYAQTVAGVDPLTVTISPSYPAPYTNVLVTPGSTLIDLSSTNITFSVNGKVVQKSSGAEPFTVTVGGAGQTTSITVTASIDGKIYSKNVAIHPADVALIEEPVSTTHPFYKGGALLASQGRVRLIAVADFRTASGASIVSQNLVYTWRNGDQILESSSGIGKSVLSATAPDRYRDTTITVTVATQDQSIVGEASAVLSPIDPFVRVYQNDPLLGPLFNQALSDNFTITDSERTFRAVPYFFSEFPTLSWQVNGTNSQSGQDITVRPTGSGVGSALLAIAAKALHYPQSANASLSVAFGIKKSTGIFGL